MSFETQILFFFSALGCFNGFLLSVYFAFYTKQKNKSNYFLSALLFVISIRIVKSVFLTFNPNLSELFIQIGLSACFLIGPFLYLFITAATEKNSKINRRWFYHIIPLVLLIVIVQYVYPFWKNIDLWRPYFIKAIYFQWLIYILLSGFKIKHIFKNIFSKKNKVSHSEFWILSIFIGVSVIWIAFNTTKYTSYIAGALSFSFVFYLLLVLWFFKRNKKIVFFEDQIKYANKKIDSSEAIIIKKNLQELMKNKSIFKNPNLKLVDVAGKINILPHQLSQFLNDNLGKSFSLFINEHRIEEAKRLLVEEKKYSREAIGYECGFNSKSTFFTTFKKITGVTPANYKDKA
ncbi:MAG: helix-turn-helix domain-containing protein [Cellulophaga sp.]